MMWDVTDPAAQIGVGLSRPASSKGLKKFKLVVKLTDQGRMVFRTKAENKTSALKYAKNRWPSATIVSIEEVKQ